MTRSLPRSRAGRTSRGPPAHGCAATRREADRSAEVTVRHSAPSWCLQRSPTTQRGSRSLSAWRRSDRSQHRPARSRSAGRSPACGRFPRRRSRACSLASETPPVRRKPSQAWPERRAFRGPASPTQKSSATHDCLVVGAVPSEPVSAPAEPEFPAIRAKSREISRFSSFRAVRHGWKARKKPALTSQFPMQANREFPRAYQGFSCCRLGSGPINCLERRGVP